MKRETKWQGPMPRQDRTRLETAWKGYRMALDSVAVSRNMLRAELRTAIEAGHRPVAIARLFGISRQALNNLLAQ